MGVPQLTRLLTRRKAQDQNRLSVEKSFLRIKFYRQSGRLLLCDIENTIAPRGHEGLSTYALRQFEDAFGNGFDCIILRTNKMRKEVFDGVDDFYTEGDFSQMVHQLRALGFTVVLRQPEKLYWPPWARGKWPRKPWRTTFLGDLEAMRKELRTAGKSDVIKRSDIVVIGDKFRFDVLRPLLMGWRGILVNPIGDDGPGDKFALIRPIERFTLWRLGLKRPS